MNPTWKVIREAAAAYFGAASLSAGLIALTVLPKFLSASLCFLAAASVLLADYLVFRPHAISDPSLRRRLIAATTVIAALSSLSTAYAAGILVGSSTDTYAYIVIARTGPAAHGYAGPTASYPYLRTFVDGEKVEVTCYVKEDNERWYQLSEGIWIPAKDVVPAVHTGQGQPDDCP